MSNTSVGGAPWNLFFISLVWQEKLYCHRVKNLHKFGEYSWRWPKSIETIHWSMWIWGPFRLGQWNFVFQFHHHSSPWLGGFTHCHEKTLGPWGQTPKTLTKWMKVDPFTNISWLIGLIVPLFCFSMVFFCFPTQSPNLGIFSSEITTTWIRTLSSGKSCSSGIWRYHHSLNVGKRGVFFCSAK